MFLTNRKVLTDAINEMALPWKPLPCEGGYFLMADVRECRSMIPAKYLTTHEYEEDDGRPLIGKYHLNMPDGTVPLDLAFCRWMAMEKGLTMMPNSFFYDPKSPTICDSFVRLAICKDIVSTQTAINRAR